MTPVVQVAAIRQSVVAQLTTSVIKLPPKNRREAPRYRPRLSLFSLATAMSKTLTESAHASLPRQHYFQALPYTAKTRFFP
jgi:hypothetical protein